MMPSPKPGSRRDPRSHYGTRSTRKKETYGTRLAETNRREKPGQPNEIGNDVTATRDGADDVDADTVSSGRDSSLYREKRPTRTHLNPPLDQATIELIKQSYLKGLSSPMVPLRRKTGETILHAPGDSSVTEYAYGVAGYMGGGQGGAIGVPGSIPSWVAPQVPTSSSAHFPSGANAGPQIVSLSDAVINALATRRLEEAKVTNAERMEARMRGRVKLGCKRSSVSTSDHKTSKQGSTAHSRYQLGSDSESNSDSDSDDELITAPDGTQTLFPKEKSTGTSPRTPTRSRRKTYSLYDRAFGRKSKVFKVYRKSNVRRLINIFQKSTKKTVSKIVSSEDFEALVILVIFVNCVSLALYRPTQGTESDHNQTLDTLELSLNVFFTAELLLRMIHVGSLKKYLRDPWNKFDFLLVVCGYGGVVAEQFLVSDSGNGDGSYSNSDGSSETNAIRALRALRALRPLRTITRFESLRSVVVCFVEAVPLLVSVCGLVCFFAFAFALAGQLLFVESYHQRCENINSHLPEYSENDEFGCAVFGRAGVGMYGRECGAGVGLNGGSQSDASINASINATSTTSTLQCVILESGRGHSVAGFDNVLLGMLTVFQCTTLAGWAQVMYRVMDSGAELAIPYFVCLVFFGSYFVVNLFLAVLKSKFGKAQSLFNAKLVGNGSSGDKESSSATTAATGSSDELIDATSDELGTATTDVTTSDDLPLQKTNTVATVVFRINRRMSKWVHSRKVASDKKEAESALTLEKQLEDDHDNSEPFSLKMSGHFYWASVKEHCRDVAEHPQFNHFFLALICLNTLTMSIEHHGMDVDLQYGLVIANTVFTIFFTFEVLIKIIGLGAWHFFSDSFNRFDFLLVLLAIIELVTLAVLGTYDFRGSSDSYDASSSSEQTIMSALRGLKVLRTFRVFKMFRYLSSLRVIGEVLVSSLSSFVSIAALLFLFLIVFAIVGLHVFGGLNRTNIFEYGIDDPQLGGRASFDTFYHSILTTFQVLTLEDWEFIMFKTVNYAGWSSAVFFVVWVIIGKYTFLTLFLAVTMEAFESKYDAQASSELKLVAQLVAKKRARRKKRFAEIRKRRREKLEKKKLRLKSGLSLSADNSVTTVVVDDDEINENDTDTNTLSVVTLAVTKDTTGDESNGSTKDTNSSANSPVKPSLSRSLSKRSDESQSGSPYDSGSTTPGSVNSYSDSDASGYISGSMTPNWLNSSYDQSVSGYSSGAVTPNGQRWAAGLDSVVGSRQQSFVGGTRGSVGITYTRDKAQLKANALGEWSLFIFPPHHKYRELVYDVTQHHLFEKLMFLLIGVSCCTMALESPTMNDTLRYNIKVIDMVLAFFFALEVLLKTFAFGLNKYLREKVNRLDVFIVLFTIFEIALTSLGGLGFVKSLRVLRAVRPLRALTKSAGMRLVLKSVALSIGAMFNVSAVLLLTFAVFGILGVQIFSGTFFSCNDPSILVRSECIGTFIDPTSGLITQKLWANSDLNFDTLPNALVSLFVASTLDGYGQLMFDSLDSVGVDRQPKQDANPFAFLFFCAFIVLCAFSLLNLYVGVIFYQFSRIRTLSQTSSIDLTEQQKEWAEMCRGVLRLSPRRKLPEPNFFIRRAAYRAINHVRFEKGVLTCLVLSGMVTASTTRNESLLIIEIRTYFEVFFFTVFLTEALVKITALGWREYKRASWNRFDFFCVLFSFLDVTCESFIGALLLEYGNEEYDVNGYNEYRYSDVTALTHNQIVYTATARILGLVKVLTLLRIVKHASGLRSLLETLTASLPAFWNVGALVLLLFFIYAYVGVITFGTTVRGNSLNEHANFESFPYAMLTLFRVATNDEWVGVMQACSKNTVTGWASYPYFISFVILVSMVMLNLFTAVIIENFENSQDHENWKCSPNNLRKYVEVFYKFDNGSGTVRGVDLEKLIKEIPPPLGLGSSGHGRNDPKQNPKALNPRNPNPGGGMLVVHFINSLNVPLDGNGRAPFKRTIFELVRRVCECDMPPGDMRDGLEHAVRKQFPDLWEPIPNEMSWSALMCVVRVQRHWRAKVKKRLRLRAIELKENNLESTAHASQKPLNGKQAGRSRSFFKGNKVAPDV